MKGKINPKTKISCLILSSKDQNRWIFKYMERVRKVVLACKEWFH